MQRRDFTKADGRSLYLYGDEAHTLPPLQEGASAEFGRPHLYWHPLRHDWMINAAHRTRRGFAQHREVCPFCPGTAERATGEIPFTDFEAAVFENMFPAVHMGVPEPPPAQVPTAKAVGVCELVIYTPEHEASLATLDDRRRELVVRVWADRYRSLYEIPEVEFVYVFENRGAELGASLEHPHGQIYALPYVPRLIQTESEAFREAAVLADHMARLEDANIIAEDDSTVAFVPPWARYPYEVWVVPRRVQPGPWTFDDAEIGSFARILADVVGRYERLVEGREFPYMMLLHAAPKGTEDSFHFHVEFCPPLTPAHDFRLVATVDYGLLGVESSLEASAAHLKSI